MIEPYTEPHTAGYTTSGWTYHRHPAWRNTVNPDVDSDGFQILQSDLDATAITGQCFGAQITVEPEPRRLGWEVTPNIVTDSVVFTEPRQLYLSTAGQDVTITKPHTITWWKNIDGVITEYATATSGDGPNATGPTGSPLDHIILARDIPGGTGIPSVDFGDHAPFQGWGVPDWDTGDEVLSYWTLAVDPNFEITIEEELLRIAITPTWPDPPEPEDPDWEDWTFISLKITIEFPDETPVEIANLRIYRNPGAAGIPGGPTVMNMAWVPDQLWRDAQANFTLDTVNDMIIRIYDTAPPSHDRLIGTITPNWASMIEGNYFCAEPIPPFEPTTMDQIITFNFSESGDPG